MSISDELGNFTPVVDSIAKRHGLVRAAVFGRIWRMCQRYRGVCDASLESLSDGLGVSAATVQRHAVALCDDGYLEDVTPSLRNKPHTYRDTGKARITVTIIAEDDGLAESNVTLQSEKSLCTVQSDVAESQLKKTNKRQDKRQETNGADKPRPVDELFNAIARSCEVDPATAGASIGKVKAALLKAKPPYTADEVRAWRKTWPPWRDKPPTLWQLKEQIGSVRVNGNGKSRPNGNGKHRVEPDDQTRQDFEEWQRNHANPA